MPDSAAHIPGAPAGSPTRGPRRGYYIFVTEACNLRCDYCFVSDKQNHRHLAKETADRILAYIAHDGAQLQDTYIHFFGGEPLIRPAMIDYLAGALRAWGAENQIGLRFGVTTNGTLLTTSNCEMLQRHGIGVQLSLDGSKKGNDIHRQLMGGTQCGLRPAGAFDLVQTLNYMKYFGGAHPNCRMTVTTHNLPYLAESIRELHATGFTSFSIIPDADCGAWTPPHLAEYESQMERVFGYWARHRDIRVNAIDQTIDKLLRRKQHKFLCGAGTAVLGITVDGDIYPCHDFAGKFAVNDAERAKLLLGNVADGAITDRGGARKQALAEDAKSGNGYDCLTCWAKWNCARGCPYMNYARAGDILTVNATYCATARVNATLALRWMSALDGFKFLGPKLPQGGCAVRPAATPEPRAGRSDAVS